MQHQLEMEKFSQRGLSSFTISANFSLLSPGEDYDIYAALNEGILFQIHIP